MQNGYAAWNTGSRALFNIGQWLLICFKYTNELNLANYYYYSGCV